MYVNSFNTTVDALKSSSFDKSVIDHEYCNQLQDIAKSVARRAEAYKCPAFVKADSKEQILCLALCIFVKYTSK